MRPPSPRMARRISLSLILLSAALAICAILFHRMHDMALDRAGELLAEGVSVQALKAGHWLDEREAAFRLFASHIAPAEAMDPARAEALAARLSADDAALERLAVLDAQGRVLWGEADSGLLRGENSWARDAAGPASFAAGIYPTTDGNPRVVFSQRLSQDEGGWYLKAEADPAAMAPASDQGRGSGWVLARGQGPLMALAGRTPGPGLDLGLRKMMQGELPRAERLAGKWLAAAARLPGRDTIIAAFLPEPVTPYKNTGLALTVMASVCLAYAGYVRARSLKG